MPKIVKIEQSSPMSPDELEAALKNNTRFSLFPYQGSPIVGSKRLKGRVKKSGVKVGLTKRDWWTLLQPVFHGQIEASTSGGSRLVGQAGLPAWMVWHLRITTAMCVPLAVTAIGGTAVTGAGPEGMALAAAGCLVGVVLSIAGIGLNLSHAEQQLPDLEATLADISRAGLALTEPQSATSTTRASSASQASSTPSSKGTHTRQARSKE